MPNWRDADVYTVEERLALDYGERITRTDLSVDDDFFAELKSVFSEAQIVELTAGIAMENYRSKFNNALAVTSQGFCLLPEK